MFFCEKKNAIGFRFGLRVWGVSLGVWRVFLFGGWFFLAKVLADFFPFGSFGFWVWGVLRFGWFVGFFRLVLLVCLGFCFFVVGILFSVWASVRFVFGGGWRFGGCSFFCVVFKCVFFWKVFACFFLLRFCFFFLLVPSVWLCWFLRFGVWLVGSLFLFFFLFVCLCFFRFLFDVVSLLRFLLMFLCLSDCLGGLHGFWECCVG